MRRRIIIANWKENKNNDEAAQYILDIKGRLKGISGLDIVICPSFVSLITANDCARGSIIKIGAQDISEHDEGAYTGDVSAGMVKDFCEYAIIGHSERRIGLKENDSIVNKKLQNAIKSNIKPILCIGEDQDQRNSKMTEEVVLGQLTDCLRGISRDEIRDIVIAYEPVWAISSGDPGHVSATPDDAEKVHRMVRRRLTELYGEEISSQIRIIYGGSVKPENINGFLEKDNIDGALVGSASLDVGNFLKIIGD